MQVEPTKAAGWRGQTREELCCTLSKPAKGTRLLDLDRIVPFMLIKRIYKNRSAYVGRASCVPGPLLGALHFLTCSLAERSCCPRHSSHFCGTPHWVASRPC